MRRGDQFVGFGRRYKEGGTIVGGRGRVLEKEEQVEIVVEVKVDDRGLVERCAGVLERAGRIAAGELDYVVGSQRKMANGRAVGRTAI